MRRTKQPAVYIMASRRNGTLYIGVTSDLSGRVAVHKQDLMDGFTKRYAVHQLVYFELCPSMIDAIAREKALKKKHWACKIELIEMANPDWLDLYPSIVERRF